MIRSLHRVGGSGWLRPWLWLFMLPLALHSLAAQAHAPGLSSMDLALKADAVDVKVTFALEDIEAFAPMDTDLDAEVSTAERDAAKPTIAALIAGQLEIDADAHPLTAAEPGRVDFDAQNNAHVTLHYALPAARTLAVQSRFLALLPEGHQQYVTVRDAGGRTVLEKMLSRQDRSLLVDLVALQAGGLSPGWLKVFADFLKLGVEHILTGYDHLLFLFGLLAVTHSFWPAIKIITFFTVAHSLTLACAALNVVELPSSFVEPFIAATIVYVGGENLIRGDHPRGRHWLTFGFGLVHGFGFASVLREMDIGGSDVGIVLPLLSFNLGIESGQIAVAALVLPCIWWLNGKPRWSGWFLKGCSLLISLMGAYWLLQRTLWA